MTLIWLGDAPDLDPALVGGKARSINKMRALGLPVPAAFVLSTGFCTQVADNDWKLTEPIKAALRDGLRRLEEATQRRLGDAECPLLVSVRSGGAVSMPGMMDTILNLGMTADVEISLGELTGDRKFAADTRRRFVEQFQRVVGKPAGDDPWKDLVSATEAVFASWDSLRARAYRDHYGIGHDGGSTITVQAMVFGNCDENSGTGVLFTRNPLTGDRKAYGEWLPRRQGEDVVSGRFDALSLDALKQRQPIAHNQLLAAGAVLEREGRDMQDIEFTVEAGQLWLLQCRRAKRSPQAAVRIAVQLGEEGIIERQEAVAMVNHSQLIEATGPHVDPNARQIATVLASGQPACPGIATGRVVSSCAEAQTLSDGGVDVVLARPTTDPDDVTGMIVSSAVITEIGGSTSHAAVVSRELGTPCIVGCGTGAFDRLVGRVVTVDGTNGEVLDGVLPLADDRGPQHAAVETLRAWAEAASVVF